jgi:hypothetical protein
VNITNFNHSTAASYFARLSDEFLRTYFVLGVNKVAHYGRYFVMAHCLELSFKASLANRSVLIDYKTHNLECLENQLVQHGDVEFEQIRPDATAKELFSRIYGQTVRNFPMQEWRDHREALELLVCYNYAADLKYGIDKNGRNLLAVAPSTGATNSRFLGYISIARRHFPDREELDKEMIKFVAGIEHNFPTLFSTALAALQLNAGRA